MGRLFPQNKTENNNQRGVVMEGSIYQTDPPYLVLSGIDPILCSSLLETSSNNYRSLLNGRGLVYMVEMLKYTCMVDLHVF